MISPKVTSVRYWPLVELYADGALMMTLEPTTAEKTSLPKPPRLFLWPEQAHLDLSHLP